MTPEQVDLGSHVSTHRAAGGFTGFQNRAGGRALLLTLAGAAVGFIPGLVVALITDFVPALAIFPVIGGAIAFTWVRRENTEAAVTEARIHERGVVFVDGRGIHSVAWPEISSIQAKHVTTVMSTGLVDIKGATNHTFALRTQDGTGYWLDDRIDNVAALAETVARASGVAVTRMA
ncbi:MAG: hypothetical protein ABIZ52_05515 [Candidatus Limnocylindrales bacterium]